jgi:hypothetical protein
VVVGPLGVEITAAGVVGTALVGVLGTATVGATTVPAWGVMTVPTATGCGVAGVPPFATVVCATEVCFANSSIIAIGFSTEGNGETNNWGGSKVGVATGTLDNDCVQAEIITLDIIRMKITSIPRCLLLIDSPLSYIQMRW